jgi:hypothetical protein
MSLTVDVAKTVAIALHGLRRLTPMQTAMALSVGFGVFFMCWYYFVVALAFDEMKSQRRDVIESLKVTRDAADSMRRSLPDAREPLRRLEESRATHEPQKEVSLPPTQKQQ